MRNDHILLRTVDPGALPVAANPDQSLIPVMNRQRVPLVQQADLERTKDMVTQYPCTPTYFSTTGAVEIGRQAKNSPGQLLSIWVYNSNAAVRYLQFHDTIGAPGGGAVPKFTFPIPATNGKEIPLAFALDFATGIWVTNSTTLATYTAGGADFWFQGFVL